MVWPWSKCKPIIKYDGINLSFSGIEIPNEILNFKIGAFQIKKDTLQAATDIAQIYDIYRVSNCEKIEKFQKDSPERTAFILATTKNEERLLEFLVLVRIAMKRPSEKIEQAMEDWIALNFSQKIRDEAPIIPEKVRAGEVVRESPPIKEYNSLRRNITKAKASSEYLTNALKTPKFEINQLYEFESEKIDV